MGFLGLGVGKLDLHLARHDFEAGDWLNGLILLHLKEPVQAKRLVALLTATQRRRERRRDSDGNERMVTTTTTVFETEVEVAGEGTYKRGETYEFEMRVPHVDVPPEFAGIAQVARMIRGQPPAPLQWTVKAVLEQPWKFNVKKAVSIRVL